LMQSQLVIRGQCDFSICHGVRLKNSTVWFTPLFASNHRRMAWGVQKGRRQPQAGHPAGGQPISGVVCLQGVKR
jgi:hypothetical protein